MFNTNFVGIIFTVIYMWYSLRLMVTMVTLPRQDIVA